MNQIILNGIIHNIEYSHSINNIKYDKADLYVPKLRGEIDIVPIKFKSFLNQPSDGDQISIIGNLRSYSRKLSEDKNKVDLYVYTYFDIPPTDEDDKEIINFVELDGRICKIDNIRVSANGNESLHFILANNIISGEQKINNYIPCVCFGKTAKELAKFKVGDKIHVIGRFNFRTYNKNLDNGEIELRTASEIVINKFNIE